VVGVARLIRVLRELGVAGRRPATREDAVEFRRALEDLGTTFVKLGQLLSSRPDLLPDAYIEELSKLVDEAPPVPFEEIERIVREDLGSDVVVRLEHAPLAAASIAQTHVALCSDGRNVVLKVRRPGVVEQVDLDPRLVASAVEFLEKHFETAQLLDFVEEAHNTELIAGLLGEQEELVVPAVIRPHVTERVLVLERIHGRKLGPDPGLPQERAELLAVSFFRAYIRQVT
jgi:ubiquinone biosynthesis protein